MFNDNEWCMKGVSTMICYEQVDICVHYFQILHTGAWGIDLPALIQLAAIMRSRKFPRFCQQLSFLIFKVNLASLGSHD